MLQHLQSPGVSWYFHYQVFSANRLTCERSPGDPVFPEGPEILIIKCFLMFLKKKTKHNMYVRMEIVEVLTECSDANMIGFHLNSVIVMEIYQYHHSYSLSSLSCWVFENDLFCSCP